MSNPSVDFTTILSRLYTPVVGDVLDALGYYHQFLPPQINPLTPDMKIAGRAMPVLMADVHGPQRQPFGLLTQALDQLGADEVYVCGGGAMRCAYWGEILTATARGRGAAGAIIDGYHRDTPGVLEQRWPVFSRGAYAQDSAVRTRVIDYRVPIEIGGVRINPGDILFADIDGTVVIPQHVEHAVIEAALEKASAERSVLDAIRAGMSSTDAFAKFGVL
jgi:regulator of RNase E activity RraA